MVSVVRSKNLLPTRPECDLLHLFSPRYLRERAKRASTGACAGPYMGACAGVGARTHPCVVTRTDIVTWSDVGTASGAREQK